MTSDDVSISKDLEAEHTPEAVSARISNAPKPSYLRDFVYGAIDGCVTTFAIIAGVVGAGLSNRIIIIMGFANLLADGLSMAISNYLGTKADQQVLHHARNIEENHVDEVPHGEREEIKQIFELKGFEGDLLEKVVDVITADKRLWVETMLREEWGLSLHGSSPKMAAAVTFIAFLAVGFIPLFPFTMFYLVELSELQLFEISSLLTACAFFGIGALKSRFVTEHWFRAGLETLLMGGGAAAVAFAVGMLLKNIG